VKATDGGVNPQTNSLDLEFVLTDGLDTASPVSPEFLYPSYSQIIPETAEIFYFVDIVQAQDADSSRLWYSIEGQSLRDSQPIPVAGRHSANLNQ